jgi:hypothetical protein
MNQPAQELHLAVAHHTYFDTDKHASLRCGSECVTQELLQRVAPRPRWTSRTSAARVGMDYCNRLRKRACTDALPRLPQLVQLDSAVARTTAIASASMRQRACKRNRCPGCESALPPGPGSS